MFVWEISEDDEMKQEEVDWETDDNEDAKGVRVFKSDGKDFLKDFLKYAQGRLESEIKIKNLALPQIKKKLMEAFNDNELIYSLGPKPEKQLNLVEPLTQWLITQYKNLQAEQAEQEEKVSTGRRSRQGNAPILIQTTAFETGEKRKQWLPKPQEGKKTGVKRRLQTIGLGERTLSFAEGMLHIPQFISGGKNATHYTLINDNATYSIGAYRTQDGKIHLLGGSQSGEAFGDGKEGMHAEEQQFEALRDQIKNNAHGIADELKKQPVIMHLYISKSPCAERCQKILNKLLMEYSNLQIQMYLENPYMANDQNEMVKQASALKLLMEDKDIKGRLAYQVISVLTAKTHLSEKEGPLKRWGSKASLMLEAIGEEDSDKSLAATRAERFAFLVKNNHLPSASYVSAMPITIQTPVTLEKSEEGSYTTTQTTMQQDDSEGEETTVEVDVEDEESDTEKKRSSNNKRRAVESPPSSSDDEDKDEMKDEEDHEKKPAIKKLKPTLSSSSGSDSES